MKEIKISASWWLRVILIAIFIIAIASYHPLGYSFAKETKVDPSNYSGQQITSAQIDSAIAKIDDLVTEAMNRSGVPGLSVAIVHNNEQVYAKGFGVRQVGSNQRVDENTVFQLASVSKPIGATVVAGSVGDGIVSWTDPVGKYLPDFVLSDPYVTQNVTIADLYSHRSGLPDHAGDLLEDLGFDRTQVLQRLRYLPLNPFRAVYNYTNFGLTAAAEAVANAADTNWADLSQNRLYDQLGMSSTSSRYADFINQSNKALGNIMVDGKWIATPNQRQPDAQSPAGGVSSNVVDLAKWMMMVLNNGQFAGEQIVAPDALAQALTPQITTSPAHSLSSRPSFYGLGFGTNIDPSGRVRFSHSGAFLLGASTSFALLPSENLGIVVLTNGSPIGVPEAIIASFMDLVEFGSAQFDWLKLYRELFSELDKNTSILAGKQPPVQPTPAQPLSDYIGVYENDYYGVGKLSISPENKLQLTLGPNSENFTLEHWDGNRFAFYPRGENAVGISAITFTQNKEDLITNMQIEFYDQDGMGTFTRQDNNRLLQ